MENLKKLGAAATERAEELREMARKSPAPRDAALQWRSMAATLDVLAEIISDITQESAPAPGVGETMTVENDYTGPVTSKTVTDEVRGEVNKEGQEEMKGQKNIETMFAFVVRDPKDGTEGLVGMNTPSGWMPMVGADLQRAANLEPMAQQIADATQLQIKLVHFSVREEIKTLEPSKNPTEEAVDLGNSMVGLRPKGGTNEDRQG